MFRFTPSRSLLAAAALCAALAGPIANAQASNAGIRTTFKNYNPKLNRDEARVLDGLATYEQRHDAAPIIRALRHEVADIRKVKGRLEHESASSAKGAKAKSEITRGLGLIATAYGALATDVQRASAGHPVPHSMLVALQKTDRKGRAQLVAGLKLLG